MRGSKSSTGYPGITKKTPYGSYRIHYKRQYLGISKCLKTAQIIYAKAREADRIQEEALLEAKLHKELFT